MKILENLRESLKIIENPRKSRGGPWGTPWGQPHLNAPVPWPSAAGTKGGLAGPGAALRRTLAGFWTEGPGPTQEALGGPVARPRGQWPRGAPLNPFRKIIRSPETLHSCKFARILSRELSLAAQPRDKGWRRRGR